MGAFAFSAWVFLAAFYREAVRRMALEARLSEMERSGAPHCAGLCCDMLCCAVLVGFTVCRTAPAMALGEQAAARQHMERCRLQCAELACCIVQRLQTSPPPRRASVSPASAER